MSGIVNNISQTAVTCISRMKAVVSTRAIDACAGYGNERVANAITAQVKTVPYISHNCGVTYKALELAEKLRLRTRGHMTRITTVTSGSQAIETCLKYAVNYFALRAKTARRECSSSPATSPTTGTPTGPCRRAASRRGRAPYEGFLSANFHKASRCNRLDMKGGGETMEDYVLRLAAELDANLSLRSSNTGVRRPYALFSRSLSLELRKAVKVVICFFC
ncbi:hypothetical protein F4809DRAFT_656793 [Biscogniauxia mediterranea]|nr:hypothetical protein F4809DRAFT_656793 [Biscogniauxia mediterranea]